MLSPAGIMKRGEGGSKIKIKKASLKKGGRVFARSSLDELERV